MVAPALRTYLVLAATSLLLVAGGSSAFARSRRARHRSANGPTSARSEGHVSGPASGSELFRSEGCTGCHYTRDHAWGGHYQPAGPNLSKIGAKKTAAQLAAAITQPPAGSPMPALRDRTKVALIAAYLAAQK